jgi:energy-coupling factor transporter ATP-binding protein EcfA2
MSLKQLTARVISCDYLPKQKKHTGDSIITVWSFDENKEWKLIVPFRCHVEPLDNIFSIVEMVNNTTLKCKTPLAVSISNEEEALLNIIKSGLLHSKTKDNKRKNIQLYSKKVFDYFSLPSTFNILDNISIRYDKTHDENLLEKQLTLNSEENILSHDQIKCILTEWYEKRILRKFYCLGLSEHELKETLTFYLLNKQYTNHIIHETPIQYTDIQNIYQRLLNNPYSIATIKHDTADFIMLFQLRKPKEQDVLCGQVVRFLYNEINMNANSGVSEDEILKRFPMITNLVQDLLTNYNVVYYSHAFQLEYPFLIEKTCSQILQYLLLQPDHKIKDIQYQLETLTDEQKECIQMSLTKRVSIITGLPGSGKSTLTEELCFNLEQNNKKYYIVSFTGKAVARVTDCVGHQRKNRISTMHRLMVLPATELIDYIIIDETSMITTELFYLFICKFYHKGISIVFIGDPNQLEPISWGSLFQQLIQSKKFPLIELKINHRSKDGILLNANHLIKSKIQTKFGIRRDVFEFTTYPDFSISQCNSIEAIEKIVHELKQNGIPSKDVTVLTPYNADIYKINQLMQKIYDDGEKFIVDKLGRIWKIGDRVMIMDNDYKLNLMNGTEGVVTAISHDSILVSFKDNSIHSFKYKIDRVIDRITEEKEYAQEGTINRLAHSYCLSIHKSQGSEWPFIILYVPYAKQNFNFLNSNMIYTAITRAKKKLWIVGCISDVYSACTRLPKPRRDHLIDHLVESH